MTSLEKAFFTAEIAEFAENFLKEKTQRALRTLRWNRPFSAESSGFVNLK